MEKSLVDKFGKIKSLKMGEVFKRDIVVYIFLIFRRFFIFVVQDVWVVCVGVGCWWDKLLVNFLY